MNKVLHRIDKIGLTRTLLVTMCCILCIILLSRAIFVNGMYDTHDGTNHLARFANYRIALREGQIPPRWAPNLLNHYGYPVLLLNYPLANIASLPLTIAGLTYQYAFAVLTLGFIIVGSTGVFLWLRQLFHNSTPLSLIVSMCMYVSSSFLWNLIFIRGSIGELAAFSLFPWVLYSFDRLQNTKSTRKDFLLAIGAFSLFFLSHNVSALIGTIFLALWLLARFGARRDVVLRSLHAVLVSIGLVSWFWIPALLEASSTVVLQANNNRVAIEHAVSIQQLLWSPLQFGYSYSGILDSMSFMVAPLYVAIALLVFVYLLRSYVKKTAEQSEFSRLIFASLVFFVVLFVGQFDGVKAIWQVLPFISIVQFPWRLALFGSIFALPFIHWLWLHVSIKIQLLWLFLLSIWILYEIASIPPRVISRPDAFYETFAETTSTQNENMPKLFTYLDISDWKPTPATISGSAVFSVSRWSGSSRDYTVEVKEDAVIVEPTAYFNGWITDILNTESNEMILLQRANPESVQGRLAYHLPKGNYVVSTYWSERTLPRILGNTISVLTLMYLGLVFFVHKNHNN